MTWDVGDKHVLITGATSGIGLATATELARRGAEVSITTRDEVRGARAAAEIRSAAGAEVVVRHLDLSDLDSVRSFAARFRDDHDRLDVLINNAGMMAGSRRQTPDGFEWTFGVNHLGPFLLTNLLYELLVASAPARVINVSSEVHRSVTQGLDFEDLQMTTGYSSSKAYAASKLANILFTIELDRRLGPSGGSARALHPGVVGTSFGKGAEGPRWMRLLMTVGGPLLQRPQQGATTSVLLATSDRQLLDRGLYWSSGRPKQPAAPAEDAVAAARLWTVSEQLVGLAD